MRRVSRLTTLLLALCFALAAGCGRPVERVAERQLVALLPEFVGPAEKYSSRVRGTPDGLLRGRMRSVHIDGKNVQLTPGLTVEELTLDLEDVSVDTKARRLTGVESVAFGAVLGEADLNRYLRGRNLGIPELRVALGASTVTVRARPEILEVPTLPVAVEGRLTPRPPGYRLDFAPGGGKVSIVPVPVVVLRYLADRLNPVVDLSGLRVPVRVTTSEIVAGRMRLTGAIDPADLLRVAQNVTESRTAR